VPVFIVFLVEGKLMFERHRRRRTRRRGSKISTSLTLNTAGARWSDPAFHTSMWK